MSGTFKINNIITELQTAANAARAAGDVLTALAFEKSIADLKEDLKKVQPLFAGLTFSTSKARDLEMDVAKWSLLKPTAIHATELASVIDCGQNGSITIVSGAILIKGSIAMQPITALLIADHAKRNYNGQGTAFGSQEFMHNIAVANAATGTVIEGPQFAEHDKANIHAMASGWEQMAGRIRAAAPTRPVMRRGNTASIAMAPEPIA